MLASRVYVGELHAGGHTPNLKAHPAIVDRDVFERVQRMSVPAGRNAKSDRLLARLGVLRCATCDGRMSASQTGRGYAFYRCASNECAAGDDQRAARESVVERAMPGLLVSLVGHASEVEQYEAAKAAMETAQARYDAFTADYDPLEPADVERRQESARRARRCPREGASLEGSASSGEFPIGARWDDLSFALKRRGIQRRIERIVVAPGRGDGRITIQPK
jgi:hypothetical protein